MANNQVNHPKHYNQHPAGIECISIIRNYTCDIGNALKYLWRAGLKPEMGKDDVVKEAEDLKKALWYIEDYQNEPCHHHIAEAKPELMDSYIKDVTAFSITDIVAPYTNDVSMAMMQLLQVGLIVNGATYAVYGWADMLNDTKALIRHRIITLQSDAAIQDIDELHQMFSGQRVEGIHFAKPGGERDTEPEKYDPLNVIIREGEAYCLSDEIQNKAGGGVCSPCELCALHGECEDPDGYTPCDALYASNNQYLRQVGRAEYNKHFGTIMVIDELKESLKLDDEED